jgi:hypothetical protein
MFVYKRAKNGKVYRITVPDWDVVNPLAIYQSDISDVVPVSISGIGGDVASTTGEPTGEPTEEELLAALLATARSKY